jgi:Do/DeqQ family serine protease
MINPNSFLKTNKKLVAMLVVTLVSPLAFAKFGFETQSTTPQTTSERVGPVSYADAIAKAAPAVVSIHSTKTMPKEMSQLMQDPVFRYFFGDPRNQGQIPQDIQSGIGSGVIVDKNGYILTNNHVIQDANDIKVKLSDSRIAKAKVIGSDPDTDLAILKVDLKDLPIIPMGNSDKLRVGDVVFAIGNPFGVGQTVTQGIVSATHRQDLGISTFENYIQTDAAINPGNSGGALIDAYGNLIAINNAIYTRTGGYQGIGFAIPVSIAQDVMKELINSGHITRGWLGITVQKVTDEARKQLNYPKGDGAIIAGVMRSGPAFVAGLRPGDIIISINNQATKDPSAVLSIASKLKPDTAYPIAIVRNGETLDFRVVMGKRPVKSIQEKEHSQQQEE